MVGADWARHILQTVDSRDTDGFLSFLAEDALFRFGNAQVVTGKDAIRKAVDDFFASIKGLRHLVLQTWVQPDSVIVRGDVTYTRLDGSQLTLPCANIWSMEGDRIKEYLIYIDITPLYSPEYSSGTRRRSQ